MTPQRIHVDSVLAASWCCSVGATWTVELRPLTNTDPRRAAQTGPVVEWICSGVPTELPAPDDETVDLLRERGLLLFPDGPVVPTPRTRCRQLIGYVTRDPEVLRLARMLTEVVDNELAHPMVLAAQWIETGYSVDATVNWLTAGVDCLGVAQTLLPTELDQPAWCRVD